ncbi:flippase [Candidatus Uhrbacteria bacterium]|nr:flippase [Candidatus Uhrbacteria bacterium]
MISPQRVAKNTIYTLSSAVSQKLLTMAFFIIVARYYGPAEQGHYSSALAFATLFSIFIDLGISSALTRETARRHQSAAPLVSQMFVLRLASALIVYPGMIAIAYAFHYPLSLIAMIVVAGVIAVVDTFTVACWFVLRGFQNLMYESIGGALAVFAMVVSGFSFIAFGLPIQSLLWSVLIGSGVNFAISLFTLLAKSGLSLSLRPNFPSLRELIRISAPFAAAGIFARIYTFGDMSLLPALASAQAAGWYAAGQKVMLALNIIPASLSSSMYPAMSASFASHKERVGFLCSRGLLYLAIVVLPIAAGMFLFARHLVLFVYSESYLPTARVFELLTPAIVGGFLSFPLGAVLASANRQGVNTAIGAICAFVNIVGNCLLIPLFAERGAAITASLTYLTQFFVSLVCTWEYIRPNLSFLILGCARVLLATAGMACFVILTRDSFPVLFVVAGSMLVYAVCVVLFRVVRISEMRTLIFFRK